MAVLSYVGVPLGEREHAGRDREIFQVGAELIGVDGVAGDAEVLTLLLECFIPGGLSSFKKLRLGMSAFYGVAGPVWLSPEGQKRGTVAARKDHAAV